MTTATAATTWPTEESLVPATKALTAAYNAVESVSLGLCSPLRAYMDKGTWPDPLPTTETVGVIWSFIETLRTDAAELQRLADELEGDLRQVDSVRLDAIAAARKADA